MGACGVCGGEPIGNSNLCRGCAARLASSRPLCPEQIESLPVPGAGAALLDQWGRPHELRTSSTVGRRRGDEIRILDTSVSRHHAELRYDSERGTWFLRDLGSTNGTWRGDSRVDAAVALRSGDPLWFGEVGLFFVSPLDLGASQDSMVVKTHSRSRDEVFERARTQSSELLRSEDATSQVLALLPEAELDLIEPVGGGGGYLVIDGSRVQLSPIQFELLRLLAHRMEEQSDQPDLVRGFIRSSELVTELPWDTAHPDDRHLKQLVRRLRRSLASAQVADLIEARHGLGYRLRVVPRRLHRRSARGS